MSSKQDHIGVGYGAFAKYLSFTLTTQSLKKVYDFLSLDDINGLNALLKTCNTRSFIEKSNETKLLVNYRSLNKNKVYRIQLADIDLSNLKVEIAKLAERTNLESNVISLEFNLESEENTDSDSSGFVFEFIINDIYHELENNYSPDDAGSTWEFVINHPVAKLESYASCLSSIQKWGLWDSETIEKNAYCNYESGEAPTIDKILDLFTLMQSEQSSVFQVNIFTQGEFKLDYGNAQDTCQVWFQKDNTEIIVSDHCISTGDFTADMDNFLKYWQISMLLAEQLKATTFVWGINADNSNDDEFIDINKLREGDFLCKLFLSSINVKPSKLPSSLAVKFRENFESLNA